MNKRHGIAIPHDDIQENTSINQAAGGIGGTGMVMMCGTLCYA